MKKLAILTMLLLALLVQPALAVNDTARTDYTIELPGAEITFTSPEGFLCLTRETSASVFNRWGMSQREMFAYMEESDVYALIYDLESDAIFQIEAYPFNNPDYNLLNEEELQYLCANTHKKLQLNGYEVTLSDTYCGSHHVFCMLETLFTYEDGVSEQAVMLNTCHAGYEVDVYAWPEEGAEASTVRADAKAIADTLRITYRALPVTTEEMPEGQFILRRGDVKLTFTPMDVRYCLTRESSRYMFNRMGGGRDATLAAMEQQSCYAILQDSRQRVYASVLVLDAYGMQPYEGMMDWMILAAEKQMISDSGWQIKECSILNDSSLSFVRSMVYRTEANGTVQWLMTYGCHLEGIRLEIAVTGSGEKTLEAVQAETDAFVRAIQYEEIRE